MSHQRLSTSEKLLGQAGAAPGTPVSQFLIEHGVVTPRVMVGALAEAGRVDAPLARVIAAEGLASPEAVLAAQARHFGLAILRREQTPPEADIQGLLPPEFCLEHGLLPWMRLNDSIVLACARPDDFDKIMPLLPEALGPVRMALTLEADIHAHIAERYGAALALHAQNCVPQEESCRDLNLTSGRARLYGAVLAVLCCALLFVAPSLLFAVGLGLALTSLIIAQAMKIAALLASRKHQRGPAKLPARPPTVSILIPLFHEEEIAQSLVRRLSRLTYPKSQLDVILVLEAEDETTRATLAQTHLPPWMRVIAVPPGDVMTKPRALNYALHFARGQIIGIYDAEDAPSPDQIERIVTHFSAAPPEVGCLQGILDFYNPRANWLSRCFAVEYASWFRVLLPGLSKLGLTVPLGGTTVFFRREVLEKLGGWDSYNVTEDADLGVRLARHGYRTELVATVTREEANNRLWPWVRQRSRWLKGYALTWWVHSRRPLRLLRDLGWRRFLGVQALFLTTLMQFTLAPLLWSFWLIVIGLPHPLDPWLSRMMLGALTVLFLSAEAVSILIGIAAISRSPHRNLLLWVPTLFAYFPLGTLAVYKALWEAMTRPFYWDKTQHGHSSPDDPMADIPVE